MPVPVCANSVTTVTTVPVARLQKSLVSAIGPVVANRKRMLSFQIEFSSHPHRPFSLRFGMSEMPGLSSGLSGL